MLRAAAATSGSRCSKASRTTVESVTGSITRRSEKASAALFSAARRSSPPAAASSARPGYIRASPTFSIMASIRARLFRISISDLTIRLCSMEIVPVDSPTSGRNV